MKKLSTLMCAGLVVAGCAGRDPDPVSAYSPDDSRMSCREIDSEIQRNNGALQTRVQESADAERRNIVAGAAAILLFWPAAFAMDLKDAAGTEATSLEQRNATLTQLAAKGNCRTAHAMTVAEAEAERAAREAAAKAAEVSDVQGVRTPSDQRLHQARAATMPDAEPSVAMQASSDPVDRDRLRDLMNRFLRGEISKAEYERLRAG